MKLINYKKNETIIEVNNIDGDTHDIEFSNDGKKIVVGGDDTKIRIYDTLNGYQVKKFQNFSNSAIKCIRFSKDGEKLIVGGVDGLVKVFGINNDSINYNFNLSS